MYHPTASMVGLSGPIPATWRQIVLDNPFDSRLHSAYMCCTTYLWGGWVLNHTQERSYPLLTSTVGLSEIAQPTTPFVWRRS